MGFPIDPDHINLLQDGGCDDGTKWILAPGWTIANSRLSFRELNLGRVKAYSFIPIYQDEIYIVRCSITKLETAGNAEFAIGLGGQETVDFGGVGIHQFAIQALVNSLNPLDLTDNFWIASSGFAIPLFDKVYFDNFIANRAPEELVNTDGFQPNRSRFRPARGHTWISHKKLIFRVAARQDASNCLFKIESE